MFNKKAFVIFVYLSFLFSVLYAFSDFHAAIGSGNDTWNFGLSENYDDQLSYSVHSSLEYNRFRFSYAAEGYTNRGWKDKNKFYSGRYDKFDFLLGYNFDYRLNEKCFIEFNPFAGASFIGDFGMDWYQNWVHRKSNINEVDLPYDYEDNIIHISMKEDFNIGYVLHHFGNAEFQAIFFLNSKHVIKFESSETAGFEFALQNTDYDYKSAYLYLGYGLGHSYSGNITEKLYHENIKGITYGFGLNSGLISLDYLKFLNSGYGYSYISFDFGSLITEKKFDNEDYWVSVGKCSFLDRTYTDNQIGFIFDNGLSFILKNRYANGFPILNDSEKENFEIRYKRNYSLNSFGLRYQISTKNRGVLTAYSQLDVGLSRWDFAYLYNMDRTASVPEDGNKRDYLIFADLELGLNIFPEDLLVCQNAMYQINLFGGLVYFPDNKKITKILIDDNSHDPGYKFNGFAPYFGIAMHVGIDI